MAMLKPDTDLVFAPSCGPAQGRDSDRNEDAPEPAIWTAATARALVQTVAHPEHHKSGDPHRGLGWSFLRAAHREADPNRDQPQADEPQVTWMRHRLHPALPATLGSSVAITGGLGGIGLYLAERFLRSGLGVILVDSRPLSALGPDARTKLGSFSALGSVRFCAPGDLAAAAHDAGTVPHLVACAGNLRLAKAKTWSATELDAYARHKADAFTQAAETLLAHGLRSVVAYGSTESRAPHPTFGAYAAANEILRSTANTFRARRPVQVVVAEWSLWGEVGMAAPSASFAERAGYAVVSPEWGFEATVALLTDNAGHPGELVLGGSGATPRNPMSVVHGIGGNTLLPDRDNLKRLLALCGTHEAPPPSARPLPNARIRWAMAGPGGGARLFDSADDLTPGKKEPPWPGNSQA